MTIQTLLIAFLMLFSLPILAQEKSPQIEKIILDTDIGDDIDDAYALVLAATLPNSRLLGVTTTFGETHKRAELAAKLLHICGRDDVPVFAGREGSAKIGRQYAWAEGFKSKSLQSEEAVAFMKRTIKKNPGQVTLVGIGALTNIGDLMTRYPEVKTKIKRIVIMGGAVHVGYNNEAPPVIEWNIKCDPAAAKVVYSSFARVVMAGLEVTTMMKFDAERQKQLFAAGNPTTDALAALTNLWGNGTPTQFDAVAVAYALNFSFCDAETQHVSVEDSGLTRITEGRTTNVTVLINPRKEAFLDWFGTALKTNTKRLP